MAGGRPSKFSPAVANAICDGLIEGKSLRSICLADDMPSAATVCRWLGQNAEFREQYAHAREAQADTLFDEILDIADDSSGDDKWGGENGDTRMANSEWISRSKLRVDARKWMAGKLQPKKYGEKLELNNNHGVQDSLADLMQRIDGKSRGLPG